MSTIFHIAFPVNDLIVAREFYVDKLKCTPGRETRGAIVLDFYGHQIIAHLTDQEQSTPSAVYPRHYGLIFKTAADWHDLEKRVREGGIPFYDEPKKRFAGQEIEHETMFVEDPFCNLWEFKYYTNLEAIFGHREFKKIGDRKD